MEQQNTSSTDRQIASGNAAVGKPLSRVDGRLKVTGQATYAAEHKIPHVVHALLVTSTIAKGRVSSIDTKSAESVPGVLAVMTHLNTPKLPQGQPGDAQKGPADRVVQVLQDDQVFYDNQPVAMVVAETLEQASHAAGLVRVEYETAKHRTNLLAGLPEAHVPKKAGSSEKSTDSKRGDIDGALAAGPVRMQHTYSTPHQVHNAMEPHATIAVWDSPEHLTVYDATQGVFTDRERIAKLFALKPENVHVISPFLGGGFGSKGPTWSHVVLSIMAAKQVKRPVKLVLERMQMFGPVGFRTETHQTIAAAAKQDGTITALRHDTLTHTSTFDEFVEPASLCSRMLYNSETNSTTHRLVKSDIGTPSYMRAPGEAPGTYALECAMDDLAYELKMDPLALRLKNYAEKDPEEGKPFSSKSLRECYRVGAERFGWSRRSLEPRSMRDGKYLIGWGMATAEYPTKRSPASAKAKLQSDGTLLVDAGTQDVGTGTYTIMTQIAADAFGIPASRVKFRLGDTDFPKTPVSGGSQTAASTGSAVFNVGQALREKLVQAAISDRRSPLSGATSQDIVVADGRLSLISDSSKSETLQQLLKRMPQQSLAAEASAKPGEEKERYSMYAFGAQFAEVRVDADLGQVKVSRMVGVFGPGRILNAKTARSQFIGGMVWAIGFALHEQGVIDDRLGRWVNNNLAEYHVPVNADVPDIDVLWVEEDDPHINPIGAKGIGEIGITGASAAIANAVFHATGRRVRDVPITPDKLLLA